jgi:hypothetical protein
MLALYLCLVVVAVRHLWRHRQDCFSCTLWQAWLRSSLLAFLVTPSLVGDFWLFVLPGPAALGFALMLPSVLLATDQRPELVLLVVVLYVLPWLACTTIIFYIWRFFRWRRMNHERA